MNFIIDATGKKIGRVASEAAQLLMGKDTPAFRRNVLSSNTVEIINVNKAEITDKRREDKFYESYAGFPGSFKQTTMTQVIAKQGKTEVFWRAVYGMLPVNKMRAQMIKNLKISE